MSDFLSKATEYLNAVFSQLFSKVIVSVVILLIGFIIGRIVSKLIHRILHEIELNNILKKTGAKFELEQGLSKLAGYFIYFITIIWALNALGLTSTILNMISAALLVLIVISAFLAIKDFIPNIISGFFIYRKGIVKQGEIIVVDELRGVVKKISLVETDIETDSGDMIHIPNSILTKKKIIVLKK